MKKKIWLLVFTFLIWTLIFVLQKPVFLLVYGGMSQVFQVITHGLSLDLSLSGYLSVIPALVLLISSLPLRQLHSTRASRILMAVVGGWTLIGALVVALAFVANIALYGYWGFPLDSTPLFFLFSSPSAASILLMMALALLTNL